MSIFSNFIPLAAAKDWAKRLAKASKDLNPENPWPLARCQLVVANMLKFDHWHELNTALVPSSAVLSVGTSRPGVSKTTRRLQDHYTKIQSLVVPKEDSLWPAYWKELLDIDGDGGDLFIEIRLDKATLSSRINGEALVIAQMSVSRIIRGLTAVFSPEEVKIISAVSAGNPPQYCSALLNLSSKTGTSPVCQIIPVYPDGFDIFIRAKCAPSQAVLSMEEEFNLPREVLEQLRSLCAFKKGIFFFTGTTGSGKSTLLSRVVGDRAQKKNGSLIEVVSAIEDPPEYPMPFCHAIPVIHDAVEDSGWDKAFLKVKSSTPNILLVGEIRSPQSALGAMDAAQRTAVFSTCHAAPAGLMERLQAFGVSISSTKDIRGWASCSLLPLLCPHCSPTDTTPFGYEERGPGCKECAQLGVIGRQLILDLWQVKDGRPQRVYSYRDQARTLVKGGRVSLKDAEQILGPLAL